MVFFIVSWFTVCCDFLVGVVVVRWTRDFALPTINLLVVVKEVVEQVVREVVIGL